jgi:ribosomal protein L37E
MTTLVRCKACGFITKSKRVKEVCPACGVPARMMEPYTDPLSERRRMILSLDAHPIVDHFPQSFGVAALVLSVALLFIRGVLFPYVLYTLVTVAALTPLFVLLSFATGLMDGKTRFRRVTTPILKKKIVLGAVFFVSSAIMAILALSPGFPEGIPLSAFIGLSVVSLVASFFLGLLGGTLLGSKLPG